MIKIFLIAIYSLCWIKLIRTKDCSLDDSTQYYEIDIGDNVKKIDVDHTHDDSLTKFLLKSNISFFGQIYQGVIISKDGFIKLTKSPKEKIRLTMNEKIKFPIKEALLFPFMSEILDSEAARNTKIKYRYAEDEKTLSQIKCDLIKFNTSINVNIEWSLVISWINVLPANYRAEKHKTSNTFQLALVKCERKSYLIYNYLNIGWPKNNIKKTLVYSGYQEGDHINYHLISSKDNVTEVSENSNVGIPSKWIFRIDSKNPSETINSDITSTTTLFTSYNPTQTIKVTENSITTSISQNVKSSKTAESTNIDVGSIDSSSQIAAENTASVSTEHSEKQSSAFTNFSQLTLTSNEKTQKTNFHTTISSTDFAKLLINQSTSITDNTLFTSYNPTQAIKITENTYLSNGLTFTNVKTSTFKLKNLTTFMSKITHTSKSVYKSTQDRIETHITNNTYSLEIPAKNSAFISIRTVFIISFVCLLVGLANLLVFFVVFFYKRKAFKEVSLKTSDDLLYDLKLEILNSEDD